MSNDRRTEAKPWRAKAERLIAEDCRYAYRAANPKTRKRHQPYSVPAQAAALVECLAANDEHRAKCIFQHRAMFGVTESING